MERSAYWRVFAQERSRARGAQQADGFSDRERVFAATEPIRYRGRLLTQEIYLQVPTFLRRGTIGCGLVGE